MRIMKRLIAVCLAALLLTLTLIPSLAADTKVYSEAFFWDKAGEDADNGYKAYEIPYGSPLQIPDDPERFGYVFLGWKDWDTDLIVDLSTQIMDAPGRRFYAAWQQNIFTITYLVDGAVYRVDSYSKGEQIILPEPPQKDGCVFDSWIWGMGQLCVVLDQPETMPAADLHATALFQKTAPTFTFYDGESVHAVISGTPGEAFIVPRSPEREGYTFKGWNPALPQTTPETDEEFYAVFVPNTYIATLLVDGEVYREIPYTYGQKSIDLPEVPKKDGYTGAWEAYSLGIGGVTIHALYTPKKYVATLIVDGEIYKRIVYTYGQKSITLPEVPKKQGYTAMWGPYSLIVGGTKIEAIYAPIDNTVKTVDGDADGNGGIDLKDVVLLTRSLAGGWDIRICTANMDVNNDGAINLKDVTLIRRYLAGGWGVTL